MWEAVSVLCEECSARVGPLTFSMPYHLPCPRAVSWQGEVREEPRVMLLMPGCITCVLQALGQDSRMGPSSCPSKIPLNRVTLEIMC